jgi:hypothetical protein
MNQPIIYFDEIAEFSEFQALEALFIYVFELKLRERKMFEFSDPIKELDVYDLDGNLLKQGIEIPNQISKEYMQSLIAQLKDLAKYL